MGPLTKKISMQMPKVATIGCDSGKKQLGKTYWFETMSKEFKDTESLKTCSYCKKEKPTSHFYKNKNTHDGFSTRCKDCRHITEAVQRQAYYLKNSEKIKAYRNKYNQRYKAENRQYLRLMDRLYRERRKIKEAMKKTTAITPVHETNIQPGLFDVKG